MISSFPSYDEEQPLNSAYANISLIADKAWTFDKEDPFQKLNQSLWHQHCKVTEKYKENSNNRRRRRVRDVIPESRLAAYGNYEYNEERESLYKPQDNARNIPNTNFCWTDVAEPWMLPDVEKLFAWLTSNSPETTRELSSTIRAPEPEDVSKIGCSFVPLNLSPTEKKIGRSHEARNESHLAKEINLIESSTRRKPDECYGHQRYTIENSMEMQLHIRVTSEAVRSLWKLGNNREQFVHQQRTRLPCHHPQPVATAATVNTRDQNCQGKERQQQFYYAFQYRPLILRAEYQTARTETYGMPRKHLPPVLSPEVPEFFPKISVARLNKEQTNSRVQYFPSLNERSYQNELFPYNRAHQNAGCLYQSTGMPLLPATEATPFVRPPQQWYQRIPAAAQIQIASSGASPTCTTVQPLRTTITHHPLQVQEKFLQSNPIPIPVYQHPVELYHETGQKRKNQGVDFKNLILLTKNAMKAQRGLSKPAQLKPSASYVLETRNRTTKSDSKVLRWLDKGCTSKTKEFIAANTLAPELRRFEGKAERKAATNSKREKDSWKNVDRPRPETGICVHRVAAKSSGEREKIDTRSRRRLYRDVLANTAANQAMFENVFEKRYDELEQQAMEQYRTSEESLALKYQELERQAMEQYRGCGNVPEDSSTPQEDKQIGAGSSSNSSKDKTNCSDGKQCSGFGWCSPASKDESGGKGYHFYRRFCGCKGNLSFQHGQVNLTQADNKNEPGLQGRTSTDKKPRTTVLSNSLTTLSQKISYRSKNTCKGASGDKINKSVSVRASSKRRLILVSPYEKESEAKLTRTTDLEEFYCIAQANRNIFGYYNNSKIAKLGGGDENITIIQSPRTEVWLSGFWTT